MAKTVQTVKTAGLAPSDLQALQEIAGSLARQAGQVRPGLRDRWDPQALQVNRAVKAQWARRELRGLPVPRGTRARLLKPARPDTQVRS